MMDLTCSITSCIWYHVIPTVLAMVVLHFVGQADLNEVQHDISGYVSPLLPALALCDGNRIINGIIALTGSR